MPPTHDRYRQQSFFAIAPDAPSTILATNQLLPPPGLFAIFPYLIRRLPHCWL
ncbi:MULTISPECIES: hypothetical protein [Enterobacteriaceae]|uniref:hypothetical protein n=1 Tax=Enterobacteriaceae TaxID=543 RepID=UPI0013B0523E|nr:hypothetical protein [Escherichia coli]EFP6121030.1 hypothetical protein [Shigella flexneri]EIH0340145.1 hypothetical protein [Shigella boydii]EFF0715182.1 hypothetical protein [Escherichia coli]EFF9617518.1 hypothetical protein [Escherichia coli]EFG8114099.1 hypothetical protein [Escherichia coli]